MTAAITALLTTIFGGIKQHFENRQKIKQAITENKIALALSRETHNQNWELLQLENAGWKDDVLFYAFIALFVWAGFQPERAKEFFDNLNVLPDWFIQTWFWIVASVLGVKKIGDYAPSLIKSVKEAIQR